MNGIEKYLKGKKSIFDVGTGPNGSDWWKKIDEDANILGIDLYFFPKKLPKNTSIYKMDADTLEKAKRSFLADKYVSVNKSIKEKVDWQEKFDLVVANHVLEHVKNPNKVIKGIKSITKKGGIVYIGFPESTNFTDIFYHLIHPDGGGHIQLLTKEKVISLFSKNNFELKSCKVWPDDWLWFEKLYNWKTYKWDKNNYLNQEKVNYLAEVFRKELTPKKGYFYGWEMVFEKK